MLKMQDVYRQNQALGDPQSLSKQLEENAQKLDKLRQELQKFEVCCHLVSTILLALTFAVLLCFDCSSHGEKTVMVIMMAVVVSRNFCRLCAICFCYT